MIVIVGLTSGLDCNVNVFFGGLLHRADNFAVSKCTRLVTVMMGSGIGPTLGDLRGIDDFKSRAFNGVYEFVIDEQPSTCHCQSMHKIGKR